MTATFALMTSKRGVFVNVTDGYKTVAAAKKAFKAHKATGAVDQGAVFAAQQINPVAYL